MTENSSPARSGWHQPAAIGTAAEVRCSHPAGVEAGVDAPDKDKFFSRCGASGAPLSLIPNVATPGHVGGVSGQAASPPTFKEQQYWQCHPRLAAPSCVAVEMLWATQGPAGPLVERNTCSSNCL